MQKQGAYEDDSREIPDGVVNLASALLLASDVVINMFKPSFLPFIQNYILPTPRPDSNPPTEVLFFVNY